MTRPAPQPFSESFDKITFFKGLPKEAVQRIQARCSWRFYEPGEPIVDYLDTSSDVYFITAGEARVSIYSVDGKAITFSDLRAGEIFGEIAAIDGARRSASIEARTRCCVAVIGGPAFVDILKSEPAISFALLRTLASTVRSLTTRVYEFSALDVANRTRAEVLRLARLSLIGNVARITPAPTHADIASRISTHREAVTRELNRLSKLGLIERSGNTLIVKDFEQLAELVHEAVGE